MNTIKKDYILQEQGFLRKENPQYGPSITCQEELGTRPVKKPNEAPAPNPIISILSIFFQILE